MMKGMFQLWLQGVQAAAICACVHDYQCRQPKQSVNAQNYSNASMHFINAMKQCAVAVTHKTGSHTPLRAYLSIA